MKYLPRMKSSILHLRLGGVYSDASLCLASKTLPTLDLLLPPSTDLEESLLCISLSRFEIGKEKTVLFSSSSIPSLSVSTSSFNVSKLLLTDVLLAGFDNKPTCLDSLGIEEALFEAEKGNFSKFLLLCDILKKPYDEDVNQEDYTKPAPASDRVYKTYCGT